jgi:hypothetical protein
MPSPDLTSSTSIPDSPAKKQNCHVFPSFLLASHCSLPVPVCLEFLDAVAQIPALCPAGPGLACPVMAEEPKGMELGQVLISR